MKKVLLVIISLFCLTTFIYSQTQEEMNQNANSSLKASEKKMNAIYKKILKLYSKNDLFIKNFKICQKLWIQYRNAQVDMKYPKRSEGYYGSVFPMCKADYINELTNSRIKQLDEWLKKPDEGDICTGTVGEYEVQFNE